MLVAQFSFSQEKNEAISAAATETISSDVIESGATETVSNENLEDAILESNTQETPYNYLNKV